MLCVLCGVSPRIGPLWLCETPEQMEAIAADIYSSGEVKMSFEEIAANFKFLYNLDRECAFGGVPELWERSIRGYDGDMYAVGHFQGYEPCTHRSGDGRAARHPAGDTAELRRIGYQFDEVIDVVDGERRVTREYTELGDPLFNSAVHIECYAYLEQWLDCPLPPRVGRLGKPLNLAGELYELPASRKEPPTDDSKGTLPGIDYDCVLDTYGNSRTMESVIGCWRGSKYTTRALQAGARHRDLLIPFIRDCQYWIFMQPYYWPKAVTPPSGPALDWCDPSLADSPKDQRHPLASSLPTELLLEILHYLDVPSILALAATCKLVFARVLDRATLHYALRRAVASKNGTLHWVLPVMSPHHPDEWDLACDATVTWLPGNAVTDTPLNTNTIALADFDEDDPEDPDWDPEQEEVEEAEDSSQDEADSESEDDDESVYSTEWDETEADIKALEVLGIPVGAHSEPSTRALPLLDPAFPLAAFIRACYLSDNMRARRRRWRIIKQFDKLWTDYRRNGWERDVFAPEDVRWEKIDRFWRCQCANAQ